MSVPKKRIGPKTQPTGVPHGAVVPRAQKPVVSNEITGPVMTTKLIYCFYRARWERMKHGEDAGYIPPRSYDGAMPVSVGYAEDGTSVNLDSGRPSQWHKLHKWCAGLGVNPAAYVDVAFEQLTHLTERPPEPIALCGTKYASVWRKHEPKIHDRVSLAQKIQMELAASRIGYLVEYAPERKPQSIYANVLLDTSLSLSALFRYCLACNIAKDGGGPRFVEIAKRYENDAVLQFYPFATYYQVSWEDALPPGFADHALAVYASLLRSVVSV